MSILFCFVIAWVALVWLIETCCNLVERGPKKSKIIYMNIDQLSDDELRTLILKKQI